MEQTIMLYSLHVDWQIPEKQENTCSTEEISEEAAAEKMIGETTEKADSRNTTEIAEKDLQTELYAEMPELKETINRLLGEMICHTDITGFQDNSRTAILSVEWDPSVEVGANPQISRMIRETMESFLKEQLDARFECSFQIEAAELGIFTRREQQDDTSEPSQENADYERGRYDAEIENMLGKVMEQNKDLERMIVRNQEKANKNGFVKYLLVTNIVQSAILFALLLFIFIRLFVALG